jgi:hypothetical protein
VTFLDTAMVIYIPSRRVLWEMEKSEIFRSEARNASPCFRT